MSRSDFGRRLAEGRWEFLRQLPINDGNLAEALTLGPGAPFYLSQILFSLDRPDVAEKLLDLQWRRGDPPWREEAAVLLLQRLVDAGRYGEAEALARQFLRRAAGHPLASRAKRYLLQSLYWQGRDRELLNELPEHGESGASWDDELDLFEAVSTLRSGKIGWRDMFVDLFYKKPASVLLSRAYAYLEQEGRLNSFPPAVCSFFQGKDLLYRGQPVEAIDLLESALPAVDLGRLDAAVLIRELGAAYIAAGLYRRGTETLLDLSGGLSPAGRQTAVEMAGRLQRAGGEPEAAERLLFEVLRNTSSPQQRDRAAWFLLDLAASRSPDRFLDRIGQFAPLWHDPQFFAGLVDSETSELVARRDWAGLLSLHDSLEGYGSPRVMARLAYLAGRVLELDLAEQSEGALSAQALFEEARRLDDGYYRFLAETALDGLGFPVQWSLEAAGRGPGVPAAGHPGPDSDALEQLIRGYFDYGLYESGAELLRANWLGVPAELIRESALELRRRGEQSEQSEHAGHRERSEYLLSLRLANLYLLRKQGAPEREDLELLYPRAFGPWIAEITQKEELPPLVFFALVREESHFDPAIVSRSGAVGLTQLMAETAADNARWLRMGGYDLQDPRQNLQLGAHHFSRLFSRLEDIPKTLMAYNAGLSRLRGWERNFAGLAVDLLVEAAPYPETRKYVRKILVSAVYYGALYYDQSLEQTVRRFFPAL